MSKHAEETLCSGCKHKEGSRDDDCTCGCHDDSAEPDDEMMYSLPETDEGDK